MRGTLFILLIVISFFKSATGAAPGYDVVVYGATPAGITAAVAAGREGRSVVLVEASDLPGGVMSGGLSFSDSNQMAREALGGLFEEIHTRIEEHYKHKGIQLPYTVAEKNNKHWTYEPHVAEMVFREMLTAAKVTLVLNESVKSVKTKKGSIVYLQTISGKRYHGKVFIDASYEGDLLALAGVKYTIGRESRQAYGESYAGAIYSKKPVPVSAVGSDGKPLPLISGTTLSPEGEGDNAVMVYGFRLCLSADPANQVPFTRPANYDSARYELVRRYYKAFPEMRVLVDLYPIPGNKFDGNNGIALQLSTTLVGGSQDYPEADAAKRKEIQQDHEDYLKGFLYFLTSDTAVPAPIRAQMSKLGYAKDEFAKYGNFPPALYVREARRMIGTYFMTQHDILENVSKPDAIAIGSFPIDSHDCQRIATADGFINEGTIFPVHLPQRHIGQPYQVPYTAITPKKEECNNLLVPVCLSASHVAFSSVRVEPAWMVLGESAGIAAAVAVENNVPVQDILYTELAARLKKKGQVLDLPEYIKRDR